MPIKDDEGKAAVRLARRTLEEHVGGNAVQGEALPVLFSELRGVFVTINSVGPSDIKLRGCIGFPYPVRKLGQAIRDAAIAAATEDPRFPPLTKEELNSVAVEVSILTKPELIHVEHANELPSRIRIGTDGLIVTRGGFSGLLLPQVATEYSMDQMEFLSQACMKAGLPPDTWLDEGTEVQSFQAEIFAEKSPGGEAVRVETSPT